MYIFILCFICDTLTLSCFVPLELCATYFTIFMPIENTYTWKEAAAS